MRVSEYTYAGYKNKALNIFKTLERKGILTNSSADDILNYFNEADPIEGKSQPFSDWNEKANIRAGFKNDIPGLISETLAQSCIAKIYGIESTKSAQTRDDQLIRKIDFFFDNGYGKYSVQSKTIRFVGVYGTIEKSWATGEANYLAITDIDDGECYIVEMEIIKELAGQRVDKRKLAEISSYTYNS